MKLGDCLDFIKNGAVITQTEGAKGLPITRIETLSNGVFNRDRLGYADIEDEEEVKDFILDDKDLLMSHINSKEFVGRTVMYEKEGDEKIIHGMNLLRLKTKENVFDKIYAYYWFQSPYFKKSIYSIRKDAVNQSSVSISDITRIQIELPSIEEQKNIANLLYTIDSLIKLNDKKIEKQESLIKLLYDYWFVQFDYPDVEGKPYKSSGGHMIYNEELKREIPEGWTVKKLSDLFDSTGVSTNPGEHLKELPYCPIDVIPQRKLSFSGGYNYKEALSSLQTYDKNEILIGAMRVYFHRCCISSEKGVTRTTTIVLSPHDKTNLPYYYQVINEDRTFSYAEKVSSGTQQPYVTWENLSRFMVPCPPTHLVNTYSELTNSSIVDIQKSVQQSERLKELRDFLLPLLMNGQVKLND